MGLKHVERIPRNILKLAVEDLNRLKIGDKIHYDVKDVEEACRKIVEIINQIPDDKFDQMCDDGLMTQNIEDVYSVLVGVKSPDDLGWREVFSNKITRRKNLSDTKPPMKTKVKKVKKYSIVDSILDAIIYGAREIRHIYEEANNLYRQRNNEDININAYSSPIPTLFSLLDRLEILSRARGRIQEGPNFDILLKVKRS